MSNSCQSEDSDGPIIGSTQRHHDEAARWDQRSATDGEALQLPDGYDLYKYAAKWAVRRFAFEDLGSLKGKMVLDCGMGTGELSCLAARSGAFVHGFDISPGSVALANRRAELCGVADNTTFDVMESESMKFDSGMFDCVIGRGVLHHVQIEPTLREIHRVLKPEGHGAFLEAWRGNPVFRLYRAIEVHDDGEEWPLTKNDVRAAEAIFTKVEYKVYELMVAFSYISGKHQTLLETIDERLFQIIPPLRNWGKTVALRFTK